MKIGLLAYSSPTGLGYQTYDFYRHMKEFVHKVMLVDLSAYNGMKREDWYSDANDLKEVRGIPTNSDCEWLLDGCDVVFTCETPLNFNLFNIARFRGVKSVLQYNWEFLPYLKSHIHQKPDLLASPSYWYLQQAKELNIAPVEYLPVPIDTEKIPFRKIDKVETIFHVMGRPALHDRNGTLAFLKLISTLGDKYKYKIYIQTPREEKTRQIFDLVRHDLKYTQQRLGLNLEVIYDIKDNADIYKDGELMVLPRKYGGLCLPMWEALSAGIPVIMTKISPNDKVLPQDWLVSATAQGVANLSSQVPYYNANSYELPLVVDRVVKNIKTWSPIARELAETMSWQNRKPILLETLIKLCSTTK